MENIVLLNITQKLNCQVLKFSKKILDNTVFIILLKKINGKDSKEEEDLGKLWQEACTPLLTLSISKQSMSFAETESPSTALNKLLKLST